MNDESQLRALAFERLKRGRNFRIHPAGHLLGSLFLTLVWVSRSTTTRGVGRPASGPAG
jgi:hypothetical protein